MNTIMWLFSKKLNKKRFAKICCYVCNSKRVSFLTTFFRGGRIYKCIICKNAFTLPQPMFDYNKTDKFMFKESDYNEAISYSKPMLQFIKRFIASGKLLDVGCGVGALLQEANRVGFRAEGLEPSELAVNHCLQIGLNVKRGFIETADYQNNTFDIIVLSHVLEHVSDANKLLSKVHKMIKKNGYVFLCQTNYTGTIPKILGRFWEAWVTSQHFIHFSPDGVKFILEKNKFSIVQLNLISSGYRLLWRWGPMGTIANNLYYSLNFLVTKFLERYNFQGDQMYVMARKIET